MRLYKKMTAKQLYTAADFFPSYYYRLEKGEIKDPSFSTVETLSRIMDVKEEYFFNELTPREMAQFEKGRAILSTIAQLDDDKMTEYLSEIVNALLLQKHIGKLRPVNVAEPISSK